MAVGQLVKEKHITCRVLRTSAAWFGVTYREDKPVVQTNISELIRKGEYPASLWA
jgi:hypothetical protein